MFKTVAASTRWQTEWFDSHFFFFKEKCKEYRLMIKRIIQYIYMLGAVIFHQV